MKYCPYCGQALQKQCSYCGANQQAKFIFCSECGEKFQNQQSTRLISTAAATTNSLETKTHSITQDEEDIRKHATVVFADLKSSTNLVEGLDPEEAKNILLPVIDAMREAIYSYGGTVIKTAGDGIVAVFGAPQSLEDHALRACLSALSMHENVAKVNPALQIRVGLNSGEVYLEMLGDKAHKEYDITGQTVNLAARMEQTARPGTIQMTKYTLSLVESDVQVVSVGAIDIKGFSQPVEVYELTAVIENKLISEVRERPTFLPFMGRENEINLLNKLTEKAKNGEGNAAGIISDAGQGRSRLIYEYLRRGVAAENFTVLMTSCYSHSNNTPYAPLRKALHQLMGITHKETLTSATEKIQPFIANSVVPHARQAALVLLGIPSVDPEWEKLEVQIKRKYQIETIMSILFAEALKKPLVFIMEDIFWIDSETEAFLDEFISSLGGSRVFLILTSRSEYVDHWIKRKEYTQIKLEGLSQIDEASALNTLLGNHPGLQEIKSQLLQNCAGNPFFLEEMVKSLIQDKILVGTVNHYQLSEKALAGKLQLPESIFAVIQTQLDSLSSLERKILRMASVIGERFTYRMLTKIMDEESSQSIQQGLRILTANQYIYETRIYPEPESAFKHALIHEVAYNSLLKSLRKVMHIKILTVLESLPVEDHDLQLLAYHAYQGESWEKAFKYCYEAGHAMFFSLSANKAASVLYEKALTASEHLPKTPDILERCLAMHMFLITIYRRLCRLQEEGRHINALHELLKSTEEKKYQSLKVLLDAMTGSYNLSLGDVQKARLFYEKAHNDSMQCEDKMMIPLIESYSTYLYVMIGEYDTLYEYADNAVRLFPSLDYRHELFPLPMGHFANFLKWWAHAYTGDYQPKKYFEMQVTAFIASTDIHRSTMDAFYVLMPLGALHYYQGQYEKAIEYLSRVLVIANEIEILGYTSVITALLGCAHLKLNQIEESKKFINQAKLLYDTDETYTSKVMVLDLMTEALLLAGDYSGAKKFCQNALDIADRMQLAGIKSTLLRLSAEIDLHLPSPDYAAIKYQLQLSMESGGKLGMISNKARCQLVLANMYQQMGDIKAYEQALQMAHQSLDELGIRY